MTSTPSPDNEAPRGRTSVATPTVIPPVEVQIAEFVVGRLNLAPGEVLLVKTAWAEQPTERMAISDAIHDSLSYAGMNNLVLVVPAEFDVSVITREQAREIYEALPDG